MSSQPPPFPDAVPLTGSISGTPPRAPGSVRRTSSIDMGWPAGLGTPLQLVGRSRDLVTPIDGEPFVAGAAEMRVTVGAERTITSIATTPERPGIEGLVGTQGGSYLRGAIDQVLPGEREAATPLHVLLDDIAGASLIGGFAWSRWPGTRQQLNRAIQRSGTQFGTRKGKIICSGLRPGGWAQIARETGQDAAHAVRPAGDISTPDDAWGWHEFPERPPVCMRRHRRIDMHPASDSLFVDAFFRDSCWEPDGTELALHEYSVRAEVDAPSLALVAVTAQPHVLPFPECPWAAPHVTKLVGRSVLTFRTHVQETLRELDCCTHLNDMLRCLAEVPALASAVRPTASVGS
jgi:hypothetical protein